MKQQPFRAGFGSSRGRRDRVLPRLLLASGLRPAAGDDLAVVEAVVRAAYAPFVARIGRMPAPMLDDYRARIGKGEVHVAERDGIVQGVLVLVAENDAMLLDNVAVAPQARGRASAA